MKTTSINAHIEYIKDILLPLEDNSILINIRERPFYELDILYIKTGKHDENKSRLPTDAIWIELISANYTDRFEKNPKVIIENLSKYKSDIEHMNSYMLNNGFDFKGDKMYGNNKTIYDIIDRTSYKMGQFINDGYYIGSCRCCSFLYVKNKLKDKNVYIQDNI